MKIIMLMFDTLNRHHLPNYGCDWTMAPNFQRLGDRTVTFDRSYVCSMPCMPARNDLHAGRPNFLHRSWGPIEPFADSVFEILKNDHDITSHLTTDHYHYFEDGGLTYHQRYSTWNFNRGQEGDPWIGQVADPAIPECVSPRWGIKWRQDWINRTHMRQESEHPQTKTFQNGIEFIRRNHEQDNWILQIEMFDPHEPYFSDRKYKDRYAEHYNQYRGKHFDWPHYRQSDDVAEEEIQHIRHEYASLLTQCDANLGTVIALMDEMNLWDDTMLIVWTDHGFFLGEKQMMGKCWMPFYEEVAHTPFFVWDPRCGKHGERRQSLVQPSIDIAPTMMRFLGVDPTPDMTGKDLASLIADDTPVREMGLFGIHGGHVNVTDGRYVYMRGPANDNRPLYDYTLMPTHIASMFGVEELQGIQLAEPFSFTKGCRLMKIETKYLMSTKFDQQLPTMLFDLEQDPEQKNPIENAEVEQRMMDHMIRLMKEVDAPAEQYERLGLNTS